MKVHTSSLSLYLFFGLSAGHCGCALDIGEYVGAGNCDVASYPVFKSQIAFAIRVSLVLVVDLPRRPEVVAPAVYVQRIAVEFVFPGSSNFDREGIFRVRMRSDFTRFVVVVWGC